MTTNEPSKEEKWRELKDKALDDFIDSGALATNQCPNHLRDAYFRAGFNACSKLAIAEIEQLKAEVEELKLEPLLYKISKAFNDQHDEITKLKAELACAVKIIQDMDNRYLEDHLDFIEQVLEKIGVVE